MYVETETNSLRTGSFIVTDYNVDGTYYSTPYNPVLTRFVDGQRKLFKGQVGGKFRKEQFPPKLNPVQIGTETESSTFVAFSTVTVPNWGHRTWIGHLPAEMVARLRLLETMGGPGAYMDQVQKEVSLQKAYSNMGASDFNSQLFLAELSETLSMLRNPLAGVAKIHKKYSRGRKRLRELLRAQANVQADLYLQYMFGIAPFINDVQNIFKLVQDVTGSKNRGYSKGTQKNLEKTNQYGADTSYTTKFRSLNYQWSGETMVKTTSKIYYRRTFDSTLLGLVEKWGFNPILLPITLWETVPLSFVVDWFFGVKLWMQSYAPKPQFQMLANCTTEKLSQKYELKVLNASMDVYSYVYRPILNDCTYKYTYDRIIRQVNQPIPHTLGVLKGIDDIGKTVSSLALAWQKLKL